MHLRASDFIFFGRADDFIFLARALRHLACLAQERRFNEGILVSNEKKKIGTSIFFIPNEGVIILATLLTR
jgi:hypothetical protein